MPTMRCKHCRYRLDGLADNRCPECGEAFDPNDPALVSVTDGTVAWRLMIVGISVIALTTGLTEAMDYFPSRLSNSYNVIASIRLGAVVFTVAVSIPWVVSRVHRHLRPHRCE